MYTIFEKDNILLSNGEIILREFNYFYNYEDDKSKPVLNKYAIWINDLSISHLRKAKHLFIDGTWYRPDGFVQILIILYKDIITNEKLPGCFIIMNNKKYTLYKKVLESFVNIITQNKIFNLEIESITSDEEIALINSINEVFCGVKRFNCYFHYKKNILDKLRKIGLLKKKNNEKRYNEIKEVIKILGRLPIEYDGDMEYFMDTLII